MRGLAANSSSKGHLSNPDASPEAKALYQYLRDISGKKTLTGQQESIWLKPEGPRYELNYIQQVSGKEPAVLGLDYIDPNDRAHLNDRATAWYASGGIATICWHWGNPLAGPGYNESKIYFDVKEALKDGTAQNIAMMRDLDEIAGFLAGLRDRNVPVLWRPFHEFTGDWFWWGKCGPDVFMRLWIRMYDYFTKEKGLNNLIWVLGYTSKPDPLWYPGRQYVDIIGGDTYVQDHGPQIDLYKAVRAISDEGMPIALHECGPIPDPDLVVSSGAGWLYFLVWHTQYIHDGKTNPPDFLKRVYNCDRYLTKDELPDLRHYVG